MVARAKYGGAARRSRDGIVVEILKRGTGLIGKAIGNDV